MRHARTCVWLILSFCVAVLHAQESLTNETILKLVKAGIGEATIVGMVNQQPGKYTLTDADVTALKAAGVSEKILAAMIVKAGSSNVPPPSVASPSPVAATSSSPSPLTLLDATPIRLRLNRNLSSSDAQVGETVDFEVLDDLVVDSLLLVPRGGTAIATVTEAQAKRRMARGGKLDVNIDFVRLADGGKVALRAVKEVKGGGHTGAMTGAIVATSLVFFPAAPFFLFMHGKDVIIPKGTEITAYVNGEIKLDRARFAAGGPVQAFSSSPSPLPQPTGPPASAPQPTPLSPSNGLIDFTFVSNPPSAVVAIGGMAIGRTPFTTKLSPGVYRATFYAAGYENLIQQVTVATGYPATVNATLKVNGGQ